MGNFRKVTRAALKRAGSGRRFRDVESRPIDQEVISMSSQAELRRRFLSCKSACYDVFRVLTQSTAALAIAMTNNRIAP